MKISQFGIDFIKKEEGLRLEAYYCPAGVETIGYGSTWYPDGKKVKIGDRVTPELAEGLLRFYIEKVCEKILNEEVVCSLNQNQFDSLCSLIYNIGERAFLKSTLLKELNSFGKVEASWQILKWDKITVYDEKGIAKKVVSPVLRDRRRREYNLFIKKGEE